MKLRIGCLYVVFWVVLAALTLSSCCSVCRYRYNHPRPLEHTVWHLVKLGGESLSLGDQSFNLMLDNGVASVVMGCNSVSGFYRTDGVRTLTVSLDAVTLASCPEYEAIEKRLCQVLQCSTHYDVDYDMLLVISDATIKAVFKALPDKPAAKH